MLDPIALEFEISADMIACNLELARPRKTKPNKTKLRSRK